MAAQRTAWREARCVAPVQAMLGEGPLWIADEAALYWVDILQAKLFRYFPAQERSETCATPHPLTSLAPMTRGQLLCTGYQNLHRFDTQSGEFATLNQPKIEQPGVRINDGCCHPDGAFWFGTMDLDERASIGDFHRLAPDGRCERIAAAFAITNGPAFAASGDHGYFVDTLGRRILHADMRDGRLSGPLQLFAQIADDDGYPDGITVDAQGGVWCAHWGGARVTRFDAAGRVSEVIRLPVSNVTKCAFGGEDLDRLFITTARKGIDREALATQPLAGGLFEVETGYRGVAASCYRGTPLVETASSTCVFESS
jgi:sugar lactone lactonase YvrE